MTRSIFSGACFALICLSGIGDRSFAGTPSGRVSETSSKPLLGLNLVSGKAAVDDFVFVPSDAILKQLGQTRQAWNRRNPRSEKAWRRAWAVNGTRQDTGLAADIRHTCTAPADGGQ